MFYVSVAIVHANEYPDKTVAQLDVETKNKLSHRAQAMSELTRFLKENTKLQRC